MSLVLKVGGIEMLSYLSLKPGEEEIKKKGWWQFWRRV